MTQFTNNYDLEERSSVAKCFPKRKEEAEQIPLDYKQVKVVEFLRKEGKVTNRQVQEMLNVSHQTAYEVLQGLVESGVIKQAGKGRAAHYVTG